MAFWLSVLDPLLTAGEQRASDGEVFLKPVDGPAAGGSEPAERLAVRF